LRRVAVNTCGSGWLICPQPLELATSKHNFAPCDLGARNYPNDWG
jgi:hypothetical protein